MKRSLLMIVFVLTALDAAAQLPYRIEGVHADISIKYSASNWSGGIALDTPLPQYNNQLFIPPNQARIAVNNSPSTLVNQPASSSFNFIGAGAGNQFWRLSQNNLTPNQVFLGINSEGMAGQAPGQGWASWNPTQHSANPGAPNVNQPLVEFVIQKVTAPAGAHFSSWFTSGGTPRVYASTYERGYEPLNDSNSLFVPLDGHLHLNWAFTEFGRYRLEMTARTFYFDENGLFTELASNPATPFIFTFDVGKHRPLPGDTLNPFIGIPRPIPEPVGLLSFAIMAIGLRFSGRFATRR